MYKELESYKDPQDLMRRLSFLQVAENINQAYLFNWLINWDLFLVNLDEMELINWDLCLGNLDKEEDEQEDKKESEKNKEEDKDEEDDDRKEMRRKKNLQVEKEFWDWIFTTNQIPPNKTHFYQEKLQQVQQVQQVQQEDKKEEDHQGEEDEDEEDKDDLVLRLSSSDED